MTNGPHSSRPAWVGRAAVALLMVDVIAFVIQGANRPARPSLAPAAPTTPAVPGGTGTGGAGGTGGTARSVIITPPPGTGRPSARCFLIAATPQERARGLMGRRSLGGYAGMAFVYAGDSNDSFYMRDTLIPLDVAFFSRSGTFLSSAAMPPCPPTTVTCPEYSAAAPFRLALEVPLGQMGALGVGPGTVAALGGPCTT